MMVLNRSEKTVLQLLREGKIKATKVKTKWQVTESDLREYVRNKHG